jgi:hypothetical protein
MKERMEKMGFNFEVFSYGLKKYNCVIAGSFPLLSFYGEDYNIEFIDIDVYGIYNNKDDERSNKYESSYPIHIFEEFLNQNFKSPHLNLPVNELGKIGSAHEYSYLKDIKYCRRYAYYDKKINNNRTMIDFMSIKSDNVYKFINKTFDLSFCKIIYDGESLHINYNDFDNVVSKRGYLCCINNFSRYESFTYRGNIEKYDKVQDYNSFIQEFIKEYHKESEDIVTFFNTDIKNYKCNCYSLRGNHRTYCSLFHQNFPNNNCHCDQVCDHDDDCEVFNYLLRMRKSLLRMKKYEGRGFTIDII